MSFGEVLVAGRPAAMRWSSLVLPTLALAASLLISQTELDMTVQSWLWHGPDAGWTIDAKAALPRALFYDGPKVLLVILGVAALLAAAAGYRVGKLRPFRRELTFVGLALALVPTVASNLKAVTDVYCPSQLAAFGGRYAHVPPFHPHPEADRQPGRCFPAGHASGGFALLALAFVSRRRTYRLAGILAGLGAGGLMGAYQMAKGAHFLSHTLTTAALAWLMIAVLALWMNLPRPGPGDTACP